MAADPRTKAGPGQFATDSLLEGTGFEPLVPLLQRLFWALPSRRRRHERRSHLQGSGPRRECLPGVAPYRLFRGINAKGHREEIYFSTADLFGGAVFFFRGAPFGVGGLRAALTALPAWNRTALLAAIWMASPVCGFRPSRAGRAATLKMPSPETRTASPATRASTMTFTTAFTAWPAAAWFSSVA